MKESFPVRDIQVLTPVRKGALGSIFLNKELQQALNPPRDDLMERKFGEKLFRENDKVMQIKKQLSDGLEETARLFRRTGDF